MGCCLSYPSGEAQNSSSDTDLRSGDGEERGNAHALSGNSSSGSFDHRDSSYVSYEPPVGDASSISGGRHRHRRQHRRIGLAEHYNQPLHPHEWTSRNRAWTPGQLEQEREIFFDTCVQNRREIWEALAMACSMMRDGDIASAQSVVDAAGITVPTGDVCDGCYDEGGALYKLPEYVVADPSNMAPDKKSDEAFFDGETVRSGTATSACAGDSRSAADEGFRHLSKHDTVDPSSDFAADGQGSSTQEQLAKGKIDERDLIQVKARLSPVDRDVVVTVGKDQSIRFLEKRIHEEAKCPLVSRVRVFYSGHHLDSNRSLLSQGWTEGDVVTVMITTPMS